MSGTRPQALFLPEACDYIASSGKESAELVKSVEDSEFVRGIQHEARINNVAVNVGVHEPASEGKIWNTLLWITPQGDISQRYQKLHLFDVDLKEGPTIKESDSTERGPGILPPFQSNVGCLGLAICFDLRFPEMSLSLRRQGAEVLTYPSAFAVSTGRAHWHTLLRARAIETQTYVLAAAQVGQHNGKRASYGHSLVVGPWGDIKAELSGDDNGPEIALADIDLDELSKVRRQMPLSRRLDLYAEI
ncbi:MAG: hypothetical protein Q9162_007074 [Coniocarpon cinnabarinum]